MKQLTIYTLILLLVLTHSYAKDPLFENKDSNISIKEINIIATDQAGLHGYDL